MPLGKLPRVGGIVGRQETSAQLAVLGSAAGGTCCARLDQPTKQPESESFRYGLNEQFNKQTAAAARLQLLQRLVLLLLPLLHVE